MRSLAKMLWHELARHANCGAVDYALLLPSPGSSHEFCLDVGTQGGLDSLGAVGDLVTPPATLFSTQQSVITKSKQRHRIWLPISISEHVVAVMVLFVHAQVDKKIIKAVASAALLEIGNIPLFTTSKTLRTESGNDYLTGLPGRVPLLRKLSLRLKEGRPGTLIYIDIDEFQLLNERMGDEAGDRTLQSYASQLQEVVENRPESMSLYRYGSDEFVIYLEGGSEQAGYEIASYIKEEGELASHDYCHPSCSIGVYHFLGSEECESIFLIEQARNALMQAKEKGRDAVHRHSETQQRRGMLCMVIDAMDNDELYYDYQPVVDLTKNEVLYYESLARANDKRSKPLSPAVFIPILESSSAINLLDKYTMDYAFDYLLQRGVVAGTRIGINVSGKSLERLEWINNLERKLSDTGLNPSLLVIEMTETWMRRNKEMAKAIANRVKELGCGFALDDFGAGAHSYQDLLSMPADYVKVDASLIGNMTKHIGHYRTVEHIVSAAKSMGMEVIAEGIEDHATLEAVRSAGIKYAQGYHIAKPSTSLLNSLRWEA